MSDDIPIIFALDLQPVAARTAVFLSAASLLQMQQYAAAGWTVRAAPGFSSKVEYAAAPAEMCADDAMGKVTLVSCEAPELRPDTSARIARWQPEVVKINCAFHGVKDAGALVGSLEAIGYGVLGARWQADNGFNIRGLVEIGPLTRASAPDWDTVNVIGVRDPSLLKTLQAVGRLYAGEERRISELQLANAIRGDTIARLEDALVARQPSALFKLQRT